MARSASSACATASRSRPARQLSRCSSCSCSALSSTTRMCDSSSSAATRGESVVSVNRLTPITAISPASILRTRSAWLCTSRCFIASIMAKAPPPSSTHASSASAASASSAVFFSTTCEPANRSSYSRRSVSNASTCWIRSDHCWSQGRGSPSASFHAGSWIARARASCDSVTPRVSSTMRCTLFSGCASVSPSEFTCTPKRNRRSRSSVTP